jgi:2-oxoisovalerate dehydrogenase E1 component alpha subunit
MTLDPLEMYRTMLLARALDERMWQLNRQGRAHFAVPCAGHEGAAVGFACALDPARDWLVPHYRDLAALLVYGVTPREVMCHLLGKAADPMSGGRQMYAHWGYATRKIFSVSSPQPNHVTHAVGIALAQKLRYENGVTWCGFGDGSSSKGDAHEAMNFAAIHQLPIVFCVENNSYAISTPQKLQMAIENVADRAAGYGFRGMVVNGSDVRAVYKCAREAIEQARAGNGPTLVEIKVYRFMPHTSNDDDKLYRAREEVDSARLNDPVTRFRDQLRAEKILDDAREQEVNSDIAAQVDDAIAYAEACPNPSPQDLYKFTYTD